MIFQQKKTFSSRWRNPPQVTKVVNDYEHEVEDICNNEMGELHVSRLRFYRNDQFDRKTLLSLVIQ